MKFEVNGHVTVIDLAAGDAGFVWRCTTCGALGYGHASNADASDEAVRHVIAAVDAPVGVIESRKEK